MAILRVLLVPAIAIAVVASGVSADAQQWTPLVDHDHFDIDFQLFAPADLDPYGDGPQPNVGWYFTYDRLYWAVSRPQLAPQPTQMDFTWGNRIDVGFMTEERTGWAFTLLHVDGPVKPFGLSDLADDAVVLNNADLSSFELNKVWRIRPFHNGAVLEPFVGARYMIFRDRFDPDNYVHNHILGGQVGARLFKKKGRWLMSGECRFFAGEDFQYFTANSDHETVPMGEIRAEAAYEISREFAVRFGYEMLHMGQGVARGLDTSLLGGDNSEDLTMHGVTFGITLNR